MDEILSLREEIDAIDRKMADLFAKRMECAGRIAAYKRQNGLPITDAGRENAMIAREQEYLKDPSLRPLYARFLSSLITLSKEHQEALIRQNKAPTQTETNGGLK